jgi:hypothetical protein
MERMLTGLKPGEVDTERLRDDREEEGEHNE